MERPPVWKDHFLWDQAWSLQTAFTVLFVMSPSKQIPSTVKPPHNGPSTKQNPLLSKQFESHQEIYWYNSPLLSKISPKLTVNNFSHDQPVFVPPLSEHLLLIFQNLLFQFYSNLFDFLFKIANSVMSYLTIIYYI